MARSANDNQMYVALCSPARATTGDGYKAWGFSGVADPMFVLPLRHSSASSDLLILDRGRIVAQLGEKEGTLYADIGRSRRIIMQRRGLILVRCTDMEEINKTRASIPVTVQRRFDVYPDVSQSTKSS